MTYLKAFTSFLEDFEVLTDEECGRLFRAQLRYARDGSEPQGLTGNERILWPRCKRIIDEQREVYLRKVKQLQKNAAGSGSPISTDIEPISAQECKSKSKEKENKEKEQERVSIQATAPSLEELMKYVDEKLLGFDARTMFNYYEQTGWKTKNGVQITNWKAAAQNWAKRERKHGNDESATLGGTRYPAGVTPQTVSGTGKFKLI